MKRAVFTIVAKNYMASALSLRDSVEKFHPDVDFYIVLADRWESEEQSGRVSGNVLVADPAIVPEMKRMSFFYDVVEYSTSIKPFYFKYFLEKMGYESVIYLDPDTWVMDELNELWDELSENSVVLTPHIVDIRQKSGYYKETHILNRGVYNLGFIGCSNTKECLTFLDWWGKQLSTECIRSETRFVDQKWAEYIPAFLDSYYINKSKTYNISDWNYHERKLRTVGDDSEVCDGDGEWKKIRFFHFSGIKMQSVDEYISKLPVELDSDTKLALNYLVPIYQKELQKHDYDYWHKCAYSNSFFDNGAPILLLHRRLARSLYVEKGKTFDNYFSVDNESLYSLFKSSNMIDERKIAAMDTRESARSGEQGGKGRARKIIKWIISRYINHKGVRKYEKLISVMHNNADIDQQWRWLGDKL